MVGASIMENSNGFIEVATIYSENSNARGALLNFIFLDNFTQSIFIALDRTSNVLPFRILPGFYKIFVYDIEHNGALSNGVGYPAVTKLASVKGQGKIRNTL